VLCFSSSDEVADRVIVEHELTSDDTSTDIIFWEEDLRDDRTHSESKLCTDLILCIDRK
jgi:hypothetical protein